MAFLCPARRNRTKVKIKGARPLEPVFHGRITGSTSIDTLVRVGLEKEHGPKARMVVLHDFQPCVDDELAVQRGEEVQLLYQENDWMYVLADNGREGFIPYTYCLPIQKCAEDFVTPQLQNEGSCQSTDKDKQIESDNKNNNFATIKHGGQLTRRSSKSLQDINVAAPVHVSNHQRYPTDSGSNTNTKPSNIEDETYGMSLQRDSRSRERRPRSLGPDVMENWDKNGRQSKSQPTSPVRGSSHWNTVSSNKSYPNSPSNTNSDSAAIARAANLMFHRTNARHSARSDTLLHSWNPASGQRLHVPNTSYLSSSYPTKGFTNGMIPNHTGSYQNSPGSQISQNSFTDSSNLSQDSGRLLQTSMLSKQQPHVETFEKNSKGDYVVLFQFSPQQENDIVVDKGEIVTVLNTDDNDWLWVRRSDNQEGFVPKNYLVKIEPHNSGKVDTMSRISSTREYNQRFGSQSAAVDRHRLLQHPTMLSNNNTAFTLHNKSTNQSNKMDLFNNQKTTLNSNDFYHKKPVSVANISVVQNKTMSNTKSPNISAMNPGHSSSVTRQSLSNGATPSQWTQQTKYTQPQTWQQTTSVANPIKSSSQMVSQSNPGMVSTSLHNKGSSCMNSSFSNNSQVNKLVSNPLGNSQISPISQVQQVQNVTVQLSESNSGAMGNSQDNNMIVQVECLYNYIAQVSDDLTVKQDEILIAYLAHSDNDWLWVYSPKQHKTGYVPRSYTRQM